MLDRPAATAIESRRTCRWCNPGLYFIFGLGMLLSFGCLCLLATTALAQNPPPKVGNPTFEREGKHVDVREGCSDFYYPTAEVRTVSDVPLSLLISKVNGEWTFGPAAGLDALGLWFILKSPDCMAAGAFQKTGSQMTPVADPDPDATLYRIFEQPKGGAVISAFVTVNASYTVFPVEEEIEFTFAVPDPNDPGMTMDVTETEMVEEAIEGAYFSLGGGLLLDIKWITGNGKGNRFAFGAVGRGGYFSGNEQWIFSFGPLLNISIF